MDSRNENSIPTGRFAPTPSGEMHAGNLLCALLAYLSVKSKGGRFLVRIEDLDRERCPRFSAEKIISTLDMLGLKSDEAPLWQSERQQIYREKERLLADKARIYPCFCTRAQLHAAEAPRLSDGGIVYSGACRNLTAEQIAQKSLSRRPCFRVEVSNEEIVFDDLFAGRTAQNLREECGDFILRRSDGVYAYQFAVAVDDGESGVTEVVRGDDLLMSTPRQIWLMRLLGYAPPSYYHIPLVCDGEGRKLSKSEGDSAANLVENYPPERVLGFLAFCAGITDKNRPATLDELVAIFSWQKVRKDRILLDKNLLLQ
ncbi:MAG: tRNA glutamyl-Q(34) synthetase GluQRS [Clostridiales bacterium]|nr:tRNA glutamyl-Q(34) synthetase GluQRS [Clostridiales bacterium]